MAVTEAHRRNRAALVGALLAALTAAFVALLPEPVHGLQFLAVTSPVVLATGYIAHGVWDVAHHPRAITTTVAHWYPPFCLVYDVLVGVFAVVWLTGLSGAVAMVG